ncbi:MAG: BrnT family toxin [Bauldia sp.]
MCPYIGTETSKEDIVGFDWDDGNRAKCTRHGVSIADIESLFDGEPAITTDAAHSQTEIRVRAVGRATSGRFIFRVFTIRERWGQRLLRPVSARYVHRKEIRRYEETKP